MKPISIYVHIPFCEKKCYYCDFNSYGGKKELIEPYIEALSKEIELYKDELKEYEVKTIFLGGGTPSILTGEQMTVLIGGLLKNYSIAKNIEITMEMNPGTVTLEKLKQYYNVGVNRLSIGLQACQDSLLKKLGRIHNYQEFLKNLQDAQRVGFKNINVDLMFALPDQKMLDWKTSLKEVASLGIQHISAYSLIWEEGTPFYQWNQEGKLKELEEDLELEMYHEAMDFLQQEGFQQYEISNFAKEGFQCQHNLTYWHNQSYIGFGAGAHSYRDSRRYNNAKEIFSYINELKKGRSPVVETINNSREDEISETMFLGLRLMEGIEIEDVRQRFGISPLQVYEKQFKKLIKEELIIIADNKIKLTKKGIDLSNVVFREMLL